MSEEGDIWRAVNEANTKKRWDNKENSLKLLNQREIKYICLSEGEAHYRIGDFDFWPTTGKFINRKTKKSGRGVFNLIKILKNYN